MFNLLMICQFWLDQADNELDISSTIRVMRSNYEGPASILSILANKFEARGNGTLVGISSVAGERGRASNYVYGSAKAGFTAFLSGLRNRLAKKGVHVVTVLPGFIATKMTDGLDLPVKLTARPEELATCIEKAIIKKKNIIYVKPIWEIIMMVIRNIPERVFKGLKI
jgi:decaprenylphospho-beta-D-erythro-pentofuranosid-2-ulose 2-reductase